MIGKVLNNRYRIDKEIGQGGMGTVYLGFDTALERQVAIKALIKSGLGTEGRTKLINEAQIAAKLNHPNIVTIYDVGEEANPFIVMEYVEGITLREHPPDNLDETLAIICQLTSGLEHAHEQGIIHRDLKPENVVITLEGTTKLMDFGLARSVASRYTTEGLISGTVYYLAPEQAMGQQLDSRTDLYSLGVMLYELTTGELPFTAENPIAVISQHLHAPVVPPRVKNDEISPALDALIVGLLEKNPQDRPASAKDVIRALESPNILDVEAAPVREFSMLERIVRGRMVGREKELEEARNLWTRTVDGEGQLLLIGGEPGVGKTRLMREIVAEAEVSGGQTLIGASYAEGDSPYGAFKQIVREALSTDMDNGFELPINAIANLLIINPELGHRFPDLPEYEISDIQTEQQRLMESIVVLCVALSDRAPLLLVLEDAHWADSGTLLMLRHLARNTRHQRVMIIATYRDVELDEARSFHEILLDLNRERLARYLRLSRLNRIQTRDMLAILFAEEITTEFLEGIYYETEGNPFFVEEVCKVLVDSGKLIFEEGQWQRPSIEELGIPQSIRMAVQSRVLNLPEEHQEILFQAAIIGREFEFNTLEAASESEEDTVIEALKSAERSQLIEEMETDKGETHAFVHALIPASLVESLRPKKLRRMHRRAAAAFEQQDPDNFEALAYHNLRAGLEKQGVEYLLLAGDRARGLFAHQEAIASYKKAVDLLVELGDFEKTARTLMKLGLTYHNAFEFEESRRVYEHGFIAWQRAGESSDLTTLAPKPLKAVYLNPATLDSSRCIDDGSSEMIFQLFSGLVELSPNLSVLPDVAHSWEVQEGGRKYIFRLRDNVYWSDGVQVTAGDFEYAWRRVLDPSSNPWSAGLLSVVKGAQSFYNGELSDPNQVGVHALDELTLVVELEEPTSFFLQLLTYVIAFPIPQHLVEVEGEAWTDIGSIVTNGPFKLAAWEREESAVFERNPAYHGRFFGNLERVEASFFTGGKLNLLDKYERDDIDFLHLIHLLPTEADAARQQYAGEYITGPYLGETFIGFDVSRPPLDDRRVRRALILATSREKLASIINRGLQFPATGGLVPPGMPGHSPNIALPYNPEEARMYLAKAGYPEGRGFPIMDCLAPDVPSILAMIASLRDQWLENLGIVINCRSMEWEKFLEQLASPSSNMWFMGIQVDYPDPDYILRVVWGMTNAEYRWQNTTYEKLVNNALHLTDQEKRIELYQQADRILVEEAPMLPLEYGRVNTLVKPWVKNLIYSPMNPPFWKDIIIELD